MSNVQTKQRQLGNMVSKGPSQGEDDDDIECINFQSEDSIKMDAPMKKKHDMKELSGAGCVVNAADAPIVASTIACFVSFIIYGACFTSLGAALPVMARQYDKSASDFGIIYTTRGVGVMVGSIITPLVITSTQKYFGKDVLSCVAALLLCGLPAGLVLTCNNFYYLLVLYFFQGSGFGFVDTVTNIALPELWGDRVQPWMQALHSFFGIGGVVGPTLVGALGYRSSFAILCGCSALPLFIICSAKWLVVEKEEVTVSQSSHPLNTQDQSDHAQLNSGLDENQFSPIHLDDSSFDLEVTVSSSVGKCKSIDKTNTTVSAVDKPLDVQSGGKTVTLPPLQLALIAMFFYFYVGSETGYGGWISTYALKEGITTSDSDAAYLSSVFWTTLTVGRVIAIPLAIVISSTTMLRMQLGLSMLGALMVLALSSVSYRFALAGAAVLGYGLSSIFPLALMFATDYGYFMDTISTTVIFLGSTSGEATVPVLIGLVMANDNEAALPYAILLCVSLFLMMYVIVHVLNVSGYYAHLFQSEK